MIISSLPMIAVLLPLFGSIPVLYAEKYVSEQFRNALAVIIAAITFLLTMMMIPPIMSGYILEYVLISAETIPVGVAFMADHLGLIMAVFTSFAWMLATIYSIGYMDHEHAKNRYYSFLILTLGATMGIVLTKNLFALYIFFEMMGITSYVLVIHEETPEAMKAGNKYLFFCIGFGLFLLLAILVTYIIAGTLDLGQVGMLPHAGASKLLYTIIFWAFIAGFGAKAGLIPMHVWLPEAHPIAPSPASALLSGVMIETGVYGIIRVIYNVFGTALISELGVHTILAIIAGISIVGGSAVAISQKEIKRMLAYSSISQMGYPILGAALLTSSGLTGAIFHLFNHAFMKGALFLVAGAIIHQTGIRNIDDFKGMGKKMPLTMLVFTIAAFSMIGVPPLNGFMSKWILCIGALEAGSAVLMSFMAVLLLSSLMNAVYYMPIIIRAFLGGHEGIGKAKNVDPGMSMLIPLLLLALGCILFGVFAILPLSIITPAVNTLFGV
ncbi:MAG: proton-conducting transporter membrane subunit [Methanocellales archaeon]|nr:proton-conducting transporter membrane subunit [Methanocellales archaeon]